jgi:predicted O-methyltransferase YrrM
MTSLQSPAVRAVLDRLYAEAERNDGEVLPRVRAEVARLGGSYEDRKVTDLLDDAFIPVCPEVGQLLYVLVRMRRPKIAVEFGASFGLSGIHIAAALRDNGEGRLITTELNAFKTGRAVEHFRQAGLADLIELRQGDAFETLTGVRGIDFLMLDGWKSLYLPLLQRLEPVLSPGCLVAADDINLMHDLLKSYLAYVREPKNGYTSCEVPIDDGLEVSLRG